MNKSSLINEIKTKLNLKDKVELFKFLYDEVAKEGRKGDTELAHINKWESRLLKLCGGAGSINPNTGLKEYLGGGGGGGQSVPEVQTSIIREAPGIEERKLGLMDISKALAEKAVPIPEVKVAPFSGLEQTGLTQAGVTGIGAPALQAGMTGLQQAGQTAGGIGAMALQGPQSSTFASYLNPMQSYVLDEINRQAAIGQQQLAGQAVQAGAFGGGREGIQRAEQERARLATIGQAQQQAFDRALAGYQTGLGIGQTAVGQQMQAATGQAQLGTAQQQMAQADINQLMAAGGLQRQLAQQTLDAARATELQRAYEPFQRAEFLKSQYQGGPTSQSGVTQSTMPTTSPLAQAAGAGLGAYAAYQTAQARAPQINVISGQTQGA